MSSDRKATILILVSHFDIFPSFGVSFTKQIRLPDGSALTNQFGINEDLAAVRLYVDLNRKDGRSALPFTFMTTFPKKVFSEADMKTSLKGLGLVPSAVLIVTKPT